MNSLLRTTLVALALAALGCVECRPGDNQRCSCTGGRRGVQLCTSEGTYGACICQQMPQRDAGITNDAE